MLPNPILGVLFHWLGGLAAGSFYVPYKGVKKWSWETYWLVGGVFSWILCPSVFALLLTKDPFGAIGAQPIPTLWWTYFFGLLWGTGGLTFGLTMRYLGMSLGMGVALGYTAAFGTLLPPIFKLVVKTVPIPENIVQIASTLPGQMTLVGVFVCLLGIVIAALAGYKKEREMPEEMKKQSISEFNFFKGIIVATFSGVMSACFAFALTAGNPIAEASVSLGTDVIWSGLPKLMVVMLGGFTTNFVWCMFLNIRNKSGYEYFAKETRVNEGQGGRGKTISDSKIPVLPNYLFSALAGTTWYFQFFFYSMGETQMGKFGFASWTLHMASIIIFSTMWGWFLKEWKGSSKAVSTLIVSGILMLILSTIIIGYSTYLKGM